MAEFWISFKYCIKLLICLDIESVFLYNRFSYLCALRLYQLHTHALINLIINILNYLFYERNERLPC